MGFRPGKSESFAMDLTDSFNHRQEAQSYDAISRFLKDLSCGPESFRICGISPFAAVLVAENYLKSANLAIQTSIDFSKLMSQLSDIIFYLDLFFETTDLPDEFQLNCGEDLIELYFTKNGDIKLDMRLPVLYALLERARRLYRQLDKAFESIGSSSTGLALSSTRGQIANIFEVFRPN